MARRLFFSFDYQRDSWRANVVRNSAIALDSASFDGTSLWENSSQRGSSDSRKLIDNALADTNITVVLIGARTANRKYINYEIEESIKRGNAILGIRIHNIKDQHGRTDRKGPVPEKLLAGNYNIYTWTDETEFAKWVEESSVHNQDKASHDVNLRSSLSGHRDMVHAITWSPDGQKLASASHDRTVRLWDVETGKLLRVFKGHSNCVNSVAWSPDALLIASGSDDKSINLWNAHTGELRTTLKGHLDAVNNVAWSPGGKTLASASRDGTVRLWEIEKGSESFTSSDLQKPPSSSASNIFCSLAWSPDGLILAAGSMKDSISIFELKGDLSPAIKVECPGNITTLAWSPDGQVFASGSSDTTVRLWNAKTRQLMSVLEGHTGMVTGVSFSSDGRLLASKSNDGTVRLWRCQNLETVSILDERTSGIWPAGIAFHPSAHRLATLGDGDFAVRIWDLDADRLFKTKSALKTIQYSTAKIVLLGDSGVGKTALGWRLAHQNFKEHPSTHGEQFWILDKLHPLHSDGTEYEAVLWDFAGQPDYRLLHTLFIDDADLGLILFDPSNRQDPLKGVEYWLKALSQRKRQGFPLILVGARTDRGDSTLTQKEIEDFCRYHAITGGYVATSARTGEGVAELSDRLAREIRWDELTRTVTTLTFKRIKKYVLKLKGDKNNSNLLAKPKDLRVQLKGIYPDWNCSYEEMMTAINHLVIHGYVRILRTSSGEEVILLAPDLLNNLAASFILEARRNPRGVGALEENRILLGDYRFPEIANLKRWEQDTLLNATIALFLEHNICFRQSLGSKTFLIFPSLINQKKPFFDEVETLDDVSYLVSGAVENVYGSLVVLLGYTNIFTRTNQWLNQAQYDMRSGEVCGFRQIAEREGEVQLVLYYGKNVPRLAKAFFQGLIEHFLRTSDVNVTRHQPVICPLCGYIQERSVVIKRIQSGKKSLFCSECGEKITLGEQSEEPVLTAPKREEIEQQQQMARLRTTFESALTWVKGRNRDEQAELKKPVCFISYATGAPKEEQWVSRLAGDLQNAGFETIYNRAADLSTINMQQYVNEIGSSRYIILVVTPKLRERYQKKINDPVAGCELNLINRRLKEARETVWPLLIDGMEKTALPPAIEKTNCIDFRVEKNYFASLLDLILRLYDIPLDNPAFIDLRESLRKPTGEWK